MQEITTPVCFSADAVERFLHALQNEHYRIHALLIARGDSVCYASAAAPYTLQTQHRLFSAAKTILVLNALFAMQEGKLRLTDRVASFFPEVMVTDPLMQRMTVEDLMTMRTGQVEDPFGVFMGDMNTDLVRMFLQTPVLDLPGTVFRYNNSVPHVIAAVTERAVGMPIERYQERRLCQPLGAPIAAPTSSHGMYNPAITCMSAESFLKYAQFFLQEGKWQGQQLLQQDLLRKATANRFATGLDGNNAGYGYQVWQNRFGGYRMDGGWGQFAFILPHENITVVMLSDMTDCSYALTAFEEHLLPAIRDNRRDAHAIALPSLAPAGSATPDDAIFDKVYTLENHAVLRLEHLADRILLHVNHNGLANTVEIGLYGMFCENAKRLVSHPTFTVDNMVYGQDTQAMLLSGAWSAPCCLDVCGKSFGEMGEYRHQLVFDGSSLVVRCMTEARHGMATPEDGILLKGVAEWRQAKNC